MSSINSLRKLQMLYFSIKNKEIKKLKNGEKQRLDTGIYIYYQRQLYFIGLKHILFDLNKLSKDTAFMFTFTSFSFVKLTASKNVIKFYIKIKRL